MTRLIASALEDRSAVEIRPAPLQLGIDLYVTGPINRFKDGIAPQTGVMETDWSSSGTPGELAIHARQSLGSV